MRASALLLFSALLLRASLASHVLSRDACASLDAALPCSLRPSWIHSPYSSGRGLGRVLGAAEREVVREVYSSQIYGNLAELIALYEEGGDFAAYVDMLSKMHAAKFPTETAEAEGFCEAAGIPMYKWVIANIRDEISLGFFGNETNVGKLSSMPEVHYRGEDRGCSDAASVYSGHAILGHNEDWSAETVKYMRMVSTPEWTGYLYPANFGGLSASYNIYGIALTNNMIVPLASGASPAYGIAYALRSVVSAKSLDEIVKILEGIPVQGGYSLNVLSACEGIVANIEGWGNQVNVQKREIGAEGYFFHFNEFMRIDAPQSRAGTSANRTQCTPGHEFRNFTEIRDFLGDYNCPMFATTETTIWADTMATFIFDAEDRAVSVYRLPTGCNEILGSDSVCHGGAYPSEMYEKIEWHVTCPLHSPEVPFHDMHHEWKGSKLALAATVLLSVVHLLGSKIVSNVPIALRI